MREWLDPSEDNDPAAAEREQRRRERETRRRQRLGERVGQATAADQNSAAHGDDGDGLPPPEDDFWADQPEPALPPLPPSPSEPGRPRRTAVRRRRIIFGALLVVVGLIAAFL